MLSHVWPFVTPECSSWLLCPWDSPGKNTGVGCHFLLQGVFPTQGSNSCLLCLQHWQVDSSLLSCQGSPVSICNKYQIWQHDVWRRHKSLSLTMQYVFQAWVGGPGKLHLATGNWFSVLWEPHSTVSNTEQRTQQKSISHALVSDCAPPDSSLASSKAWKCHRTSGLVPSI